MTTREKFWTYDTVYDIVSRKELIETEGSDSPRVKNIDSYIDFINNVMDDDLMIVTDTNPISYTEVTGADETVCLYRKNEEGRFIEYRRIFAHNEFYGHEVAIQDDEIFVVHRYYDLAVKALKKVKLVPEGTDDSYFGKRGFERMIEKGLPGFDKLEPYKDIIILGTE